MSGQSSKDINDTFEAIEDGQYVEGTTTEGESFEGTATVQSKSPDRVLKTVHLANEGKRWTLHLYHDPEGGPVSVGLGGPSPEVNSLHVE